MRANDWTKVLGWHTLLDELAEASIDGTRRELMHSLMSVSLLIIDDLGMRKLPLMAAEGMSLWRQCSDTAPMCAP